MREAQLTDSQHFIIERFRYLLNKPPGTMSKEDYDKVLGVARPMLQREVTDTLDTAFRESMLPDTKVTDERYGRKAVRNTFIESDACLGRERCAKLSEAAVNEIETWERPPLSPENEMKISFLGRAWREIASECYKDESLLVDTCRVIELANSTQKPFEVVMVSTKEGVKPVVRFVSLEQAAAIVGERDYLLTTERREY